MVDRLVTCGSLDPPFTSLHHTFEAARSPGLLIPRSSIVSLPSRIYLHLKISHPGFRLTGNPLDAMDFPNFVSSVFQDECGQYQRDDADSCIKWFDFLLELELEAVGMLLGRVPDSASSIFSVDLIPSRPDPCPSFTAQLSTGDVVDTRLCTLLEVHRTLEELTLCYVLLAPPLPILLYIAHTPISRQPPGRTRLSLVSSVDRDHADQTPIATSFREQGAISSYT
ncbi:uncharacterized protein LACBIDRAFT_330299 [Laccaria bicolor S238N-H82]|uniref:Predicted protein n=1 Tax=Laccaria bicolor (strain S238N-H82 / ATCC MYA-4686) TaxID=486041 RepID=B0DKV0_LACBS|nr:uncharacterized protein LACBIDRAFT_330299 [Laccaria bicolor S238N-H82]EDR04803.1 predicted protein [Laccaria bicolor S238N-H82]|eukprot:XP_001884627.1 predicted protein [Laccaria bicolor S238N-H82]